jgi:hypothetical protein
MFESIPLTKHFVQARRGTKAIRRSKDPRNRAHLLRANVNYTINEKAPPKEVTVYTARTAFFKYYVENVYSRETFIPKIGTPWPTCIA